jgi:hypothetical protein
MMTLDTARSDEEIAHITQDPSITEWQVRNSGGEELQAQRHKNRTCVLHMSSWVRIHPWDRPGVQNYQTKRAHVMPWLESIQSASKLICIRHAVCSAFPAGLGAAPVGRESQGACLSLGALHRPPPTSGR